jgi:hypothetical protein
MLEMAEWLAAAASIGGALMIALNLGTRVTGWGFVVLAVGSVAWVTTGILNDQTSLIVTDGVLLLVNLFGVWRWLGRQSRYEDSGARAADRSRRSHVPTLFPAASLIGAAVQGRGDKSRGSVVDAMLKCDDKSLAYVVVSEGGVGGAGETLRVVAPEHLRLQDDAVFCDLPDSEWSALPPIQGDQWPAAAPGAAERRPPARR